MISYIVYKIVHYLGIFLLLMALSAALARATLLQPSADGAPARDPWRRTLIAGHGTALFLILLGGFGMLARLGITEGLTLPGWIWAKLGIWGSLGVVVAFRRSARWAPAAMALAPLLALLAGWVALYKPF